MTRGWCRWHCLSHTKNDDFHGGVGPFHARKQISWGPTHLQKGEMPKGSFHLKRDSGNQPCSRGKSRSNLRTSKCNDWGVLFASGWKSKSPAKKNTTMDVLNPLCMFGCGFHHCRKNKWRLVMCWTPSKKDHWLKRGNQGEKLSLMKLVHPETFLHRSKLWHVFAY